MGLHRAGYEVVGVDIEPQPDYPFTFIQGDAMTFPLEGYDLIWASPICKRWSSATQIHGREVAEKHPDYITPMRERLEASGAPWIMENVPQAPLRNAIWLCGAAFGLKVYRHRCFESSHLLLAPPHLPHKTRTARMGSPLEEGLMASVVGHFSGVAVAQKAMGIDWTGQKGLAQAIPPIYAEYLARQIST